jgi:CMP-N,N'-diacetyllegionaminic acid synthase
MIFGKKVLALVPARSGSKGLPSKNVVDFLGKPLLSWSIDAALKCKYVDKAVVSTDSELIAKIGLEYGAHVPFIRPAELSEDTTSTFEVIEHTIRFMKNTVAESYDILLLLEPTSPLRTSEDIVHALEKLFSDVRAKSLVSVGRVENQFPNFQFKVNSDGFIKTLAGENVFKALRRQEIEDHFFMDGSVYISYIDELLERGSFIGPDTLAYPLPKWKNIEIDDEFDYEMAAALARKYL